MLQLGRRQVLAGAGAAALVAALDGCAAPLRDARSDGARAPIVNLPPIRASVDRITRITVCTRPFRTAGPRLDVERIGAKTVVHNYGHGGSGWSLSWGSGAVVTAKAMATGERDIAVIGCGALGLTTALLLQRAGAHVTIYAKELPPNVRSSLATGLWTPDSRICLDENATPAFKSLWEQMARYSYASYQNFLGLSGTPVEFIDNYFVSDDPAAPRRRTTVEPLRPRFAELQRELINDLIPEGLDIEPGAHSLGKRYLRRNTQMMFNLTSYARVLLNDFAANGGRLEVREFQTPGDFSKLRENTLINATGYGSRALFGDTTVTPVRGQLTRLIPQAEINYGLFYRGISFVPRRDGLVCQAVGDDDYYGYDDDTVMVDRNEATRAVNTIAELFKSA